MKQIFAICNTISLTITTNNNNNINNHNFTNAKNYYKMNNREQQQQQQQQQQKLMAEICHSFTILFLAPLALPLLSFQDAGVRLRRRRMC